MIAIAKGVSIFLFNSVCLSGLTFDLDLFIDVLSAAAMATHFQISLSWQDFNE
jgi:hypothetical protein